MTLTMVLMLWLASSYVEFKIVSRVPGLRFLFRGIWGIAISIGISFAIASTLGLQGGVIAGMAAILGLATNEFTFHLFSWLSERKAAYDATKTSVIQFRTEHPSLFTHFVATVKGGIMTIAAIFVAGIYVCGLPSRGYHQLRRGYFKVRPLVTRG